MELSDYIAVIRRRWAWVVACLLLGLVAAGIAAATTPRSYTSSTRLFVTVKGVNSVTDLNQGGQFAQSQMTSYAQVASSPVVLTPVITQLGLDTTPEQLAKSITAKTPAETYVLDVDVERHDPQEAARIADALSTQLQKAILTLSPKDSKGKEIIEAAVISKPAIAEKPSAPNVRLFLAVGAFAGLMLGLALAVIRDILAVGERKPRGEVAARDVAPSDASAGHRSS